VYTDLGGDQAAGGRVCVSHLAWAIGVSRPLLHMHLQGTVATWVDLRTKLEADQEDSLQ